MKKKNYTELQSYSKPEAEGFYSVPAPEPVSRANVTLDTAKARSSWCIKLHVIATVVNFFLLIAASAVCAYFIYTLAGDLSSSSEIVKSLQDSEAAVSTEAPSWSTRFTWTSRRSWNCRSYRYLAVRMTTCKLIGFKHAY